MKKLNVKLPQGGSKRALHSGMYASELAVVVLAVLALRLERPVPLREKLSCLGILTALTMAAVLPFALADPVFRLADYTVTPLRQILWGAMAVLVLLTVDALRGRKTT